MLINCFIQTQSKIQGTSSRYAIPLEYVYLHFYKLPIRINSNKKVTGIFCWKEGNLPMESLFHYMVVFQCRSWLGRSYDITRTRRIPFIVVLFCLFYFFSSIKYINIEITHAPRKKTKSLCQQNKYIVPILSKYRIL